MEVWGGGGGEKVGGESDIYYSRQLHSPKYQALESLMGFDFARIFTSNWKVINVEWPIVKSIQLDKHIMHNGPKFFALGV